MNRNLIIAGVLSFVVIIAFNMLFPPKAPQPVEQTPVEETGKTAAGTSTGTPTVGETAKEEPGDEGVDVTVSVSGEFVTAPEMDIPIETDLISAVISTRGGVIKSWKLKNYKDEGGNPLELQRYDGPGLPTLVVPDGKGVKKSSKIYYTASVDGIKLDGSNPSGILTLVARGASVGEIRKTYRFDNGAYGVGMDVTVNGYDGYRVISGESFGIISDVNTRSYGHIGYIAYTADGITTEKPKDVKEDGPVDVGGDKGWAGLTDMYFMAVMVSEEKFKAGFMPGESDGGYVSFDSTGPGRYILYAGPKEYDELKEIGYGLEQSVDFGWFAFIAKPLFFVLKFLERHVHNYGWAIIIMTVVIKLAFAPLTHHQQKSMKRMQKLQPMMAELKEKHKGDPQKMNAEMMELYKKHKVNPLGGCLPMLIQLPVFIALYKVLYTAIELRQAPFVWWLTDLSAKDPYYVLPVLMGISMYLMQKMTPSTMEGAQAQIFKFLPVIMVVIFINLPSGLLLYFTVSNILQMGQQFYINRFSKDEA